MGEDGLAAAEDRFRRLIDDLSPAERAAFIAKVMAGSAFPPQGSLPRELMRGVHAVIDALAAGGLHDPEGLVGEAFLRHGYHAELEDRGELAVLRVDRIQG
ncbi:MAG TPA: hypothetical protein VEA41_12425 [Salinarimonas sp.]|nr:hypothetical protein [Salinarimonas sp.]